MFDKYQEAIIRAVLKVGVTDDPKLLLLWRTSPVGVDGISMSCSFVSSLGLLPLLVVHV